MVGLLDFDFWSGNVLYLILLSCILAFLVNLSIFLTIGRTSPITYNVLGHFKLCVVTIGGTFFFHEDTNARKVFGVAVALLGITMYTYWKLKTGNSWDKRAKSMTPSKANTEDETVQVTLLDKNARQ